MDRQDLVQVLGSMQLTILELKTQLTQAEKKNDALIKENEGLKPKPEPES